MAIAREDIFTFTFFDYGEYFNGSYRGLRYRLGREPLERVSSLSKEEKEAGRLAAWAWREPFSFDATSDDEKRYNDFPYSEEGLLAAIDWLNEQKF